MPRGSLYILEKKINVECRTARIRLKIKVGIFWIHVNIVSITLDRITTVNDPSGLNSSKELYNEHYSVY